VIKNEIGRLIMTKIDFGHANGGENIYCYWLKFHFDHLMATKIDISPKMCLNKFGCHHF
jgi:hypothetical protein